MARLLRSLDLFAPAPVEQRPLPEVRPDARKRELWIAVCLPSLPFECLEGSNADSPAVVVEPERGQLTVVAASPAAAAAGVAPGAKLSSAIALAASLRVFDRVPARERSSLDSLAAWASALTPQVSIEPPDSVLLEVAGSLKLFGSLAIVQAKLRGELTRRGHAFRLCAAPTATAALWLARAGAADVLHLRDVAGRLAGLPLAVTRWPAEIQALLTDLGLRTLGDCVRLPRDGFARRVGRSYLLELDRAFGRAVDLRPEFKAPHVWSGAAELDAETADAALILEAAEQLVDELCAELERRQAQIDGFELEFVHLHRPPTVERFDLREPTHERSRLLNLLEDRLERSALPVPAVAVRMVSGAFKPLERKEDADLFETKPVAERAQALLERLQERFGSSAVYGLCAVAEHRPERAWTKRTDGGACARREAQLPREARPLWLLPQPVAIEARKDALRLVAGPERIESGWWDGHDVTRDYYTAMNACGQRLWVFRDHRTRAWFLHGLFG